MRVEIPQSVVDRVLRRHGVEHPFLHFDPTTTALIVIDMQNAFMMPGVAFAEITEAPTIVPNINRLATALRAAGGAVVWIVTSYSPEERTDWSTFYRLATDSIATKREEALTEGSVGHQIWSELKRSAEDLMVVKRRFSALVQGSSDLDAVLRGLGIETLIVTGCLTDVCCESTARDAMMLNYQVIMVTDGNAADTDDDHNGALVAFYSTFGDIMSTDMLVDQLHTRAGGSLDS